MPLPLLSRLKGGKNGKNGKDRKTPKKTSRLSSSGSVDGSGNTVFRVPIPDNVEPGQEFQVYAGERIVRVKCPPGSQPGQFLQITVPPETAPGSQSINEPKEGRPNSEDSSFPPDSPNVAPAEDNGSGPPAFKVTIPEGIRGGQQFPVTIRGQQLMVTCPLHAGPGQKVRIVPPPPPDTPSHHRSTSTGTNNSGTAASKDDEETQMFQVQVPPGVQPGKSFALLAAGVRVLVACPTNAGPGQLIRFKLPKALTQKRQPQSESVEIKLSYDKDGWTRTIRVSDMKFQWVRMDDNGDVDNSTRFDAEKSAYVRKLVFRPGQDDRIREGDLSLVPASQATVDSRVKGNNGEVLVTYSEIADAQVKGFEEKANWFQEKCKALRVEYNEGHMRINVRRNFLLEDSVDAVMSLNRKDLRKVWRFEFINEMGIDAGGLAREWFELVTNEIFDGDTGLWESSEANQMCMQINPASKTIYEDYRVYYRFLGRVMGKALFDGQLVNGHMVQYIYKHMLGWPIMFKDLNLIDEEYYNNLKQLQNMVDSDQDVETLCLDFTTMEETMGVKEEIELEVGGKDKDVTNDNFPEYMESCLTHKLLTRVHEPLTELLLGFYDVIPEPLLTVFDFQELELLMCGLPEIDMEDWRQHTEYTGDYEACSGDNAACHWFWEVVEDFDQETKARLLQFVTGTSGVPARGFAVLQGNDGNIRKFTIHGVHESVCMYPRAHTCFNRIDLPMYSSKEQLQERLKLAVTMAATGFDIE